MFSNRREDLNAKVILLGENGVGKTSIIIRYTKNKFSSDENFKVLYDLVKKKLFLEEEKKYVNFDFWDIPRREQFKNIAKLLYKNASVCVLVYDITNKNSFNEIKKIWINDVKENFLNNKGIIALVGNKNDLIENEEVSEKEAKEFANEIGAIFTTTSAKISKGIDELFKLIAKQIVVLNPPKENPDSWTIKKPPPPNDRRTIKLIEC